MQEIDSEELKKHITITIESFEGIIPYHEVFYIHSILYSADRSISAFNRYEKLLKENVEGNAAELISTIQEAIGHAAALSRYFWISGLGQKSQKALYKLKQHRAKKLREKFGLDDNSPLRERSLRDAWEHFDERLDSFLIKNDVGYFFPSPIIGDHKLVDDPIGRIFKLLDIEAECLVLLGEKYYFKKIREEVIKVYNIALNADENGGRL